MRALKRVEGINVVPLIDVVLVLLAIVLTISTFVATGQLKIELPAAKSTEVSQGQQKVEIAVLSGGELYYDGEKIDKAGLETKISGLSKGDFVHIKGDKKSAFEDFVFVMDRLKLQGLEKITIVTKNEG